METFHALSGGRQYRSRREIDTEMRQDSCLDVGKLNERRERRQAKPLTYEEEAKIKQFCPLWLSVLITLLVETGLRVKKEALPLKWSDVNLESEPVCILIRDSKTDAGVRAVWLTRHARNALIQWRRLRFSECVFPSPKIASTHISDYKKAWQKAAREAGLPDRRIYDTRATFASRASACHAIIQLGNLFLSCC